MSSMDERYAKLVNNCSEVVTESEARAILEKEGELISYWGVEPSGLLHIGQGLMVARKLKDLAELDFKVIVFLADWHAFVNDKMEGDLGNIRICGDYLIDCLKGLGADHPNIIYKYADELAGNKDYWEKVLRVSKASTVARIKRAMTIMGRQEDEADSDASKLIYPAMQVADIFYMDIDIAIGGMDQRHAHMLARDVADKLGEKKPVALHWPLLMGLQGGGRMDAAEGKMSKSDPGSCIFIHDEPDIIRKKMNKAFCPQDDVETNPVLDHARLVVFPSLGKMEIKRPEKFGGNLTFETYNDLMMAYSEGKLHPMDLKNGVADAIAEILAPAREYLKAHPDNFEALKKIIGQ